MRDFGSRTSTQERVHADYLTFCRVNGVDPDDASSLQLCAGQMRRVLAAGSVAGYVRLICKRIRRTPDTLRVARAAARAHADADTKHAADRSREEITTVLTSLPMRLLKERDVALAVYMMAATGLRFRDVSWLRLKRVSYVTKGGKHWWRVTIALSKTSKRRSQRRTVLFPVWHHHLPDELQKHLERITAERVRLDVPYNEVMQALASAGNNLGGEGKVTTYTLRRAFFFDALDRCGGDLEMTAKRFSLHADSTMLEAFYFAWEGRSAIFKEQEVERWFDE